MKIASPLKSLTQSSLPACAALGISISFVLPLLVLIGCATATSKKELSPREHAQLHVDAANAALMENNLPKVFQFLQKAEEYDSAFAIIYHLRAIAFYMRNENAQALAEIKKGIQRAPNDVEMNNTYGKILLDAGDYKNAEAPLLKSANDPAYVDAYKAQTNLGILFYRQNNLEKARTYFDLAVASSPSACIAQYYLGHIQLKQGKLVDATTSYDRATQKLCAGFADAHLALGIAYERNKQYDLARKKFVDIKQNFPNTKVAEQAMDRLTYLP
jgi:Tfp pilus assembly protein PilF